MLTHRCTSFAALLTGTPPSTTDPLLAEMQEGRYPPLLRVAALRWLIHWAPLDITKGAPYLQRRRYVRQHYHV